MELNKMICLGLFSLTFVLFWDSDKPNIDPVMKIIFNFES